MADRSISASAISQSRVAGHLQWGFDCAALADEKSLSGLSGYFSVIWSDLRSVSSSWIVRVWRKENGDVDGEDDGSGVSVSRRIRIRFCTVRTFFRRGGTDFYQFQEQGTFTVSFQPRVSKIYCPWSRGFVFWSLCLLPYVFLRISMLSIQLAFLVVIPRCQWEIGCIRRGCQWQTFSLDYFAPINCCFCLHLRIMSRVCLDRVGELNTFLTLIELRETHIIAVCFIEYCVFT